MRSNRIACATAACTAEHSSEVGIDDHDRCQGDARHRRVGPHSVAAARLRIRAADGASHRRGKAQHAGVRGLGRTRSDTRRSDLWHQHRLRRLREQSHPGGADPQASAQPDPEPHLRQRHPAARDDRAADAAAQGQQPRRRLLRRATPRGRDAARAPERGRSPGDTRAGVRRRVGRSRSARAPGARADRRRRSDS